jgi:diguanylate cyclase (GGDEF)-like protein
VFGVLLPETIGASAVTTAEKLRATVQDEEFLVVDGQAPERLTVSIGIACYPADGETADDLEHAARTALDTARALHRNTVVAASPRTADRGPTA